jgi:cytochrome c6
MKEEHVEATTKVIEDLSSCRNGGKSVTRKITTTTLAGFLALFATTGSTTLCGDTMSANAMTVRDKDVLDKGQAIFQSTCAACHKGGSNVIAKERTLTKEALTKFLGPLEGGPEDISTFVQNSNVHRGALVFSGRLTAEDYSNVAAYVYDQAMENKW